MKSYRGREGGKIKKKKKKGEFKKKISFFTENKLTNTGCLPLYTSYANAIAE